VTVFSVKTKSKGRSIAMISEETGVTVEGGAGGQDAPKKDTAKVQIRRVAGIDPVTEMAYTPFRTPELEARPHSSGAAHWHPDPGVSEFEVSADIASAAVATGAFEMVETSRVKLKGGSNANS
jgi:hypothetical protein